LYFWKRWFRYSNNKVQISIIMTSKIKVDNIENQCGGAVVTKCGATTTISGSVVKADDIQAADGGNLINQCGTTITLGASGDTVTLASGASQTGFGRTGTVDWDTTVKTSGFTAVSGNGYFVNTTSGAITVTLPASPSAGDIVSIADYAGTSATNAITIGRNGSNFEGGTDDGAINVNRQTGTFIYADATQGWIVINSNDASFIGPAYIAATGGTIVTCGDYKTHIFTGPGTFCVSCAGNTVGSNSVEYLVVAGGGGSGRTGGGGGGGGFRTYTTLCTASPLNAPAALPVSVQGYPITVGSGGIGGTADSTPSAPQIGSNSIFSTITSTGGGGGQNYNTPGGAGSGGSGGAAGPSGPGSAAGGAGNTPPVSPPQGNNGGPSTGTNPNRGGGGGGGAGAAGGAGGVGCGAVGAIGSFIAPGFVGPTAPSYGDTGPSGRYFSGGGGGAQPSGTVAGGTGGGGTGGGPTVPAADKSGDSNTGGGAGSSNDNNGNNGGPGIVMVRYKYQ
jgi:hypothetical protein